MRLLPLAAALVLTAAAPALGAPHGEPAPAPVLLVTDVGEGALRTMPAAVWRRLATESLGARNVTAEDGTALPDEARCRAAHARFAVFASFDRAMRLPGLAQENDRAYGVARFAVRDCETDTVTPTKIVRVESEPVPEAGPEDADAVAQRAWETAIRTALARDPLVLPTTPPATAATRAPRKPRVVSIEGSQVIIENTGTFSQSQVLRAYANAAGKPYAQPVQLVVVEISKKLIVATVVGKSAPHVGDYVEALPPEAAPTASAAPRR